MEVPELCATAEALIRAVAAPYLRDEAPVYIVAVSAMNDKLLDPLTAACTSPHMCWCCATISVTGGPGRGRLR